ncbi:MAG TPA: multiheme c-type cytochrome [Tepidisphaeraceae bacterium]|nr:multiheme c-type cytochrome [Tepidisphaeraceae bacterium]
MRRRATTVVVLVALAALGYGLVHNVRRGPAGAEFTLKSIPSSSVSAAELGALRGAAEAGDAHDLVALVDALNTASPSSQQVRATVAEMLRAARPEVRAAACAWIGRHAQAELGWLLLPRMSDADWRVRAAAFDAMQRVAGYVPGAPTSPAPLRDTPVDDREALLFAWINGWRLPGDALPALPAGGELCEIYAPAGGHWLTGTRLAQSCLACHAPPDQHAEADFAKCAECHREAHEEFFRSSHARSTTHLNLLRVNDRLKEVELFDPGPRQGLVCTSCHLPAHAGDGVAPLPPGTENLVVPHRFAATTACATCHAQTQIEWETWRTLPRPITSPWLPGEFTWDESPDERTCMSCHMAQRGTGGLMHTFASRRDVGLMRGGLSAHLEPPTARRGPQLVLTNLAGHRYPSGTIRRALRIELRYDTDGDDAGKRLLARLTDSPVPTSQPTQPALAPGEQRRFSLPVPNGASRVTCEITYERDQYRSGAYELPLHRLSGQIIHPIAEAGSATR